MLALLDASARTVPVTVKAAAGTGASMGDQRRAGDGTG